MKYFKPYHGSYSINGRIRYCYSCSCKLHVFYLPENMSFTNNFCSDMVKCTICIGKCDFARDSLKELHDKKSGYYFIEDQKFIKGMISLFTEEPV